MFNEANENDWNWKRSLFFEWQLQVHCIWFTNFIFKIMIVLRGWAVYFSKIVFVHAKCNPHALTKTLRSAKWRDTSVTTLELCCKVEIFIEIKKSSAFFVLFTDIEDFIKDFWATGLGVPIAQLIQGPNMIHTAGSIELVAEDHYKLNGMSKSSCKKNVFKVDNDRCDIWTPFESRTT